MSGDLVERLRAYIPGENDDWVPQRIAEAADEIERLRADNARFQEANHHYRDAADEARKLRFELAGAREQLVKNVAMAKFVRWAMREGPWDGGDLDGGYGRETRSA